MTVSAADVVADVDRRRWLAYTGSPVLIHDALYTPAHSLIDQSLHSRLGAEATNGDGFGVGWYIAEPTPGVFRSIEPAWNDQNLRELAGHVRSHLFFTHIRAAIGSSVQQTNCHPFRHGRWLWMHNGFIDGFPVIKRDLVLAVDEALYPEITGQTDTEVLFYLAFTLGLEESRSLFFSRDARTLEELYPKRTILHQLSDDARLVVSEPVGDLPGAWNEVPEASYAVAGKGHDQLLPFTVTPYSPSPTPGVDDG